MANFLNGDVVIFTSLTLAGLFIGSFLNVVIHRGPAMWKLVDDDARVGDLVGPRSYCPDCKTQLPATSLIPLVSYLAQRGKCNQCGAAIPIRYLLVELGAAGVIASALLVFGLSWAALAASVFGWMLLALGVIDLETGYLPDAMTLPLIALGLGANAAGLFTPLPAAIIGAGLGYGAFRAIDMIFQRLRGREGLGQGDAKLLAAIGAFGGWTALPFVVFIGASATLAVVAAKRVTGGDVDSQSEIPFGPGLCLAGIIIVLFSTRFSIGP
ncbi:MAG: prepilin peptidase [Parvularculaceae bacterium]|nr:prepilin peptidase [Parvularculaceae bacterium]